jgi:hypothetical protein
MTANNHSNVEPLQQLVAWFKRRDWRFWVPFIPIIVFKLVIFHFAASQYITYGFHSAFGMNFEVVEAFSDFSYYYMNFVRAFVQGNLPYTEALYMIDESQTYIYPPLFVYILGVFYYIPSELLFPDVHTTAIILARDIAFLRVGFAFLVFDVATCAVMYGAARKLTQNQYVPVVVMLVFALNPISLWWGNYLWLSTPIHTFFLVLGFFFMIRGNLRWAVVWVTVAAMTKQTAALLIPMIWFLEYRQGLKQMGISVGVTALVGVTLSLPYLLLYPTTYISAVTGGMGPYWFYDQPPSPTHPIPVSILAFLWPEPFKSLIFFLVFNSIPWILGLTFFWIVSFLMAEQPRSVYHKQLILGALLLSLVAHIFLPRGIYKFYLIALLPFLILFGAILQGPLIPFQGSSCPFQSPGTQLMRRFPPWIVDIIHRFQILSMRLINNLSTWWFLLVGIVSLSIFSVHRYFTHVILLLLFVLLLIYGSYHYIWKRRVNRKSNE